MNLVVGPIFVHAVIPFVLMALAFGVFAVFYVFLFHKSITISLFSISLSSSISLFYIPFHGMIPNQNTNL